MHAELRGCYIKEAGTYKASLQAHVLQHGYPDISPAGEVHYCVPIMDERQQEFIEHAQVLILGEVPPVRGIPAGKSQGSSLKCLLIKQSRSQTFSIPRTPTLCSGMTMGTPDVCHAGKVHTKSLMRI